MARTARGRTSMFVSIPTTSLDLMAEAAKALDLTVGDILRTIVAEWARSQTVPQTIPETRKAQEDQHSGRHI